MNASRLFYRGTENRSHRFTSQLLSASVVKRTSSLIFRLHRCTQLHRFRLQLLCRSGTTLLLDHREAPAPGPTFQLVPCPYLFLSRTGRYTGGAVDPRSGVQEFQSHPPPRPRPRPISMSFTKNQGLDRLPLWGHQGLTSLLESGKGGG